MNLPEISSLTDQQLHDIYQWPQSRSFRLNLVLSSAGEVSGTDGTSLSLTNEQDRRLLRIIRKDSDVIIVGGESVRTEGWFLPPHGNLFVLSRSGDLPWDSCPDRSRVFVFPSVASLVHNLSKSDLHILCEGGLKTSQLIAQHFGFDDIALSFTNTNTLGEIPPELTYGHQYINVSALSSAEHTMTFGFWRRGN